MLASQIELEELLTTQRGNGRKQWRPRELLLLISPSKRESREKSKSREMRMEKMREKRGKSGEKSGR